MRESELEKRFCALVMRAGGRAYKFVSPGNAGVPDRLVVLPGGRIGFVELKRPGQGARKLQRFKLAELAGLGCYTAVVDSEGRAAEVLDEIAGQAPWMRSVDLRLAGMASKAPGKGAGGQ